MHCFLFHVTSVCMSGIGLGMSFVCAPVLIGFYFSKRRALATNIASIGKRQRDTSFFDLVLSETCCCTRVCDDILSNALQF